MTPSTPSNKRRVDIWIRWMVLPLLLGVATMALISKTGKQAMEITVTVTFTDLATDLLVMDAPRQRVRIAVSATPSILDKIDPREAACRLDLSGRREGTHHLAVTPADVSLPKGVFLQALLTPSLTIQLETASQKTVGVVAVLEGNPAAGFAVEAVTLQPDRIVLQGTATMLAGIDTVKTRPINLEDASESFKKEVPLNLPDAIAVDPPLRIVVAHVKVRERIVTRVLENLPVSVKGMSAGHQIDPKTITLTISGPEAIVNIIETEPAFAVTIDLNGLTPGTHSLNAAINLPLRTTLVRVSPERFSVTINR